jgi:hypothetical protein
MHQWLFIAVVVSAAAVVVVNIMIEHYLFNYTFAYLRL